MKAKPSRWFVLSVFCLFLATGLWGCASWFKPHPKLNRDEKAILSFRFSNVGIGSASGELKRFAQIQKIPGPPDGVDIYQIFNPSSHISMAVVWFRKNRAEKIELRYIDAPGVNSLTVSGGWQGILDYMVDIYGPPSETGPQVPVVATVDGIDPTKALFNGAWIFSRVQRQLNYVATTNSQGALAVVTLQEVLPPETKTKKPKKGELPSPTPNPITPNPGF
jgi:hypothetical protein